MFPSFEESQYLEEGIFLKFTCTIYFIIFVGTHRKNVLSVKKFNKHALCEGVECYFFLLMILKGPTQSDFI